MSGYSGTPLPKKLGIKAEHQLAFLSAPSTFRRTLGPLPPGVQIATSLRGKRLFDVIVLFVDRSSALEAKFGKAAARLVQNGGLWIAWPKRSSGVATDVTESVARETALANKLVDNKVCAIDEVWSGLRCVIRLRDRKN